MPNNKITAVFSDIEFKIISEIEKANTSILVAVAWFNSHALFYKLIEKAQLGLQVEVITSNSEISNEISDATVEDFIAAGGDLYKYGADNTRYGRLMHNKFCVIDTNTVITGSYNWTNKGSYNEENVVIFRDNKTAEDYFQKFYNLLEEATLFLPSLERPAIFFHSDKVYFNPDEEITLKWNVKNADEVVINPIIGTVKNRGKQTIKIKNNLTFSLLASNSSIQLEKSISLKLHKKPRINFHLKAKDLLSNKMQFVSSSTPYSSAYYFYEGQEVVLYWDVADADKVVIDGKEYKEFTGQIGLKTSVSRTFSLEAYHQAIKNERTLSIYITPIPKMELIKAPLPGRIEIKTELLFQKTVIPSSLDITNIPTLKNIHIPKIETLKSIHIPNKIEPKKQSINVETPIKTLPKKRSVRQFIKNIQVTWKRHLDKNKAILNFVKQKINPNEKSL